MKKRTNEQALTQADEFFAQYYLGAVLIAVGGMIGAYKFWDVTGMLLWVALFSTVVLMLSQTRRKPVK